MLQEVTFGEEFKFKKHIENICQFVKYKLGVFQRIRKYINSEKAKVLVNAFSNSQFYYASMIWMFAGETLIPKVQKIYYRALYIVHKPYEKSYEDLLLMNYDISIHQNHLHFLATKIFKSVNNLNLQFMWNYFSFNPHIHKIFSQLYCMKKVPRPRKRTHKRECSVNETK